MMTCALTVHLIAVALLAASFADAEVNVTLDAVVDDTVQATSIISSSDGGATLVTVEADGLRPMARYTVLLRSGTVQQPSASAGFLGFLDTDAAGHGSLTATSMEAGAVGDQTALSPELLGDGEHLLELRDEAHGLVAVGQLPKF